jgi:AcrR family transcriptional regulator
VTAAATELTTEGRAQRKRGAELEDAIRAAVLAELIENGVAGFSVEAVAARAQTGKASIYRRWPSRNELLLDSFCTLGVSQCTPDMCVPDGITTNQAFHLVARRIAEVIRSGAGAILRELVTEAARDPDLARAIDEQFHRPRREAILALLRRGAQRGEVRPEAVSDQVAEVLPALLVHRMIWLRRTVTERDLNDIVDNVLLPLVRA